MIEDTAGVGNHHTETSAAGVDIAGTFLILFLNLGLQALTCVYTSRCIRVCFV